MGRARSALPLPLTRIRGVPGGRTDLMTARPPSPAAAAAATRAFPRRSMGTLMTGTSSLPPCPAGP